jgi:hypothetical protein
MSLVRIAIEMKIAYSSIRNVCVLLWNVVKLQCRRGGIAESRKHILTWSRSVVASMNKDNSGTSRHKSQHAPSLIRDY